MGCEKDPALSHMPNVTVVLDTVKLERKVLVIGIDGVRSDVLSPLHTPFLDSIIQDMNIFYNVSHRTENYTSSGPNWSSILTGVNYDKHNVIDNSFNCSNFCDFPPFFEYVEDLATDINTASIVNWSPINSHILSGYVDDHQSESNDSLVFNSAKDLLLETNSSSVDILFLHFDELDLAGHAYGFGSSSQEYTDRISILDDYVKDLYSVIEQKRSQGEDWLLLVVSDHGGEGTSHSDNTNPHITNTLFLSEHPTLSYRTDYISSQVDLAPTILSFIGISNSEFNYNTDGNLIFFSDD